MKQYPWHQVPKLARMIERGDVAQSHSILVRCLEIIEQLPDASLASRKFRCSALMSHCMRGAHAGGANSEFILGMFSQTSEKLAQARSWPAIRRLMTNYIDRLLNQITSDQKTEIEKLIHTICQDISSSPASNRTLAEYARQAGTNPAYLSRRFAELTGSSFRESRRQARLECAIELITNTSIKIRSVARHVGIRDVSQFIQLFKREIGLTPANYRRTASSRGMRCT